MDNNWLDLKKELKDDIKEIINLTAINTDTKLDTISVSIKEIKSDMSDFKISQRADIAALEKRIEVLETKEGEKAKGFLSILGKSILAYIIPVLMTALAVGLVYMFIK